MFALVRLARRHRLFLLFSLLLSVAGCAARRNAVPQSIDAQVVAARAGRVYVAADSGALAPGMRLTFVDDRGARAAGVVTGVLDARLASVRIESGELARTRGLKGVRVLPAPADSGGSVALRVGIPAGARHTAIPACAACTLAAPPGWRAEHVGAREWRAVRESRAETLLVRTFRDADDEEIAWERGEIDVAVFWPGELSASQRARLAPGDLVIGPRARALEPVAPDATTRVSAPGGATPGSPLLVSAAGRASLARLGAGAFADLPACAR